MEKKRRFRNRNRSLKIVPLTHSHVVTVLYDFLFCGIKIKELVQIFLLNQPE